MTTEQKGKREPNCCPYCDEEIKAAELPWCQVCGLTIFRCPKCQWVISQHDRVCPHCGTEIKG